MDSTYGFRTSFNGTLNFSRDNPDCCISIALWIEKEPKFGVIHDFNRDELFSGYVGVGSWLNNNKLEKSKKKGAGVKSSKDKKGGTAQYFPKKIVIGNKKDLRKNIQAGLLEKADIQALDGIKIKEVSALTNQGIAEAFKTLIDDL